MTGKPVEYHDGAVAEVRAAVAWYQGRSAKSALDSIEELHRAAETIRDAPDRWPAGKNGTRKFLLWRFPFSIIYTEQEAVIMIWAVAHGSRRPGYWARRVR